jgi:RimJ/RimL family protein N-acetyltransferase
LNAPDITGPGIMVKGVFYPVRTLSADDTEVLHRFLQEDLSDESRNRRFFAPMTKVPAAAAAWLADRDGHNRMALAALDPTDLSHIVALVEYALQSDGPPEVAIAVADAYHGKGLGGNVLRMMATMSLAAGEPTWQCSMLADNQGPLRVLACVGDIEQCGITGGVRDVKVHLDPSRLLGTTVSS